MAGNGGVTGGLRLVLVGLSPFGAGMYNLEILLKIWKSSNFFATSSLVFAGEHSIAPRVSPVGPIAGRRLLSVSFAGVWR